MNSTPQNTMTGESTFVASRAITLSYGGETDAGATGPALDTNDTLDLGFDANVPPVASDDPGLVATEDQSSQYSTQLTGNDTDADPGETAEWLDALQAVLQSGGRERARQHDGEHEPATIPNERGRGTAGGMHRKNLLIETAQRVAPSYSPAWMLRKRLISTT